MASVFVLLEAFNRKEAAALGFFPCATASLSVQIYITKAVIWYIATKGDSTKEPPFSFAKMCELDKMKSRKGE